ncbi:MAG: methyltransferase domain-containing protein [Candidatus Gracilibacteria bacterium]|nr:methyltransferase domain-containing protein [Candidatus Gracilibacteria bacterium]
MKTTNSLIALDIGAGNITFGRDLRRLNPQIGTVICADPYIEKNYAKYDSIGSLLGATVYNIGVALSKLTKISTSREVEEIIQNSKKGVFKAIATYENTGLPDESVDIVVLNSPHPLTMPTNSDFDEFHRVLKKGGIFYFGHSTDIRHTFDEEQMVLMGKGGFSRSTQEAIIKEQNLVFPMSPVIRSNVKTKHFRDKGYEISSINYIYHENGGLPLRPNWKAWIKK